MRSRLRLRILHSSRKAGSLVQGVMGAIDTAAPGQDRLFNLGNTHPHTVNELVSGLEVALGKTAVRHYVDVPNLGDVLQTHSNISAAAAAFNYSPQVCSSTIGSQQAYQVYAAGGFCAWCGHAEHGCVGSHRRSGVSNVNIGTIIRSINGIASAES